MTAPHPLVAPRRRFAAARPYRLACALLACTLASCSTATAAAGAESPTAATKGTTPCVVRQAARTFVALQDTQTLADFELTAREAQRVLATSKLALCRLSPAQDRDGTLGAALAGGGAEITAVHFQDLELRNALLSVQPLLGDGADPNAPGPRWIVHATRVGDDWRVVTAKRTR